MTSRSGPGEKGCRQVPSKGVRYIRRRVRSSLSGRDYREIFVWWDRRGRKDLPGDICVVGQEREGRRAEGIRGNRTK